MANIKELLERINSVSSMQQITKTMKLVSVSKFNKAQQRLFSLRPYQDLLSMILSKILKSEQGLQDNELLSRWSQTQNSQTDKDNHLIVVITADKGFCGSFNNSICKKTLQHIEQLKKENPNTNLRLLLIGKKAYNFFKKLKYEFITDYIDVMNHLDDQQEINKILNYLVNSYSEGVYNKIFVIYNKFINAATQVAQIDTYLPFDINDLQKLHENNNNENKLQQDEFIIFEPSQDEIINDFIPFYLRIKFQKLLCESYASEQASRMTNMSKATDNADALLKSLRIAYNQMRQAAITSEIIEISVGSKAVS